MVFKPSMCGCICAVYTSNYRIGRRQIGTNVDRVFRYRTAMQVLPCGFIGVLLSMQSMSFLEVARLPIVDPLSKSPFGSSTAIN
jgi:hypothetical protein